jgi:deoxyribose-phosphate aldolase
MAISKNKREFKAARDKISGLLELNNSGKLIIAERAESALDIEPGELASYIDHTLLAANADAGKIRKLCREAVEFKFYSVCVNSVNISLCRAELGGSNVKICTVIGFPLGAVPTEVKVCESKMAEREGADEIDMVINIGALKDSFLEFVFDDINDVINCVSEDIKKKVIIENCYLNVEEKIRAIVLAKYAGADFVKTSTGFGPSGATVEDVKLMRYIVGPNMGVKAAGGIRDRSAAIAMINAGANRLGASASVKIVKDE